MTITPIAIAYSPFKEKFGIPRQSGIADSVETHIVFEPQYRVAEALRGLAMFSHLWLIWGFHANSQQDTNQPINQPLLTDNRTWSPTVRPPRLGGNQRMGVFATRSPFRPNPLGLSSVRLLRIEDSEKGKILVVAGADLMDGTPIYDIKPFLPYTDNHPEAIGGFTGDVHFRRLKVVFRPETDSYLNSKDKELLTQILQEDPRPAYQTDSNRIYGIKFGEWDIRFTVEDNILTVVGL